MAHRAGSRNGASAPQWVGGRLTLPTPEVLPSTTLHLPSSGPHRRESRNLRPVRPPQHYRVGVGFVQRVAARQVRPAFFYGAVIHGGECPRRVPMPTPLPPARSRYMGIVCATGRATPPRATKRGRGVETASLAP